MARMGESRSNEITDAKIDEIKEEVRKKYEGAKGTETFEFTAVEYVTTYKVLNALGLVETDELLDVIKTTLTDAIKTL